MKIKFDRFSLAAALIRIRPFTTKSKGVRPVQLLPHANGVRLTTGAFDPKRVSDTAWEAFADVKLTGGTMDYALTFDIDALETAVQLRTSFDTEIVSDGDRVEVDGFMLSTCRVRWWKPESDTIKDGNRVIVRPVHLREALSSVIPFAAKEDTRYAINGVHFEVGVDKVHVTATDGRRLASTSVDAHVTDASVPGVTLPMDVAKALASRSLVGIVRDTVDGSSDLEGMAIAWDSNRTMVSLPHNRHGEWGVLVVSRNLMFPDWRQVLPKEPAEAVARVASSNLGGAMKGLKPLLPKGKDAFRAVRLAGAYGALSLAVLQGDGSEEHPVPFKVPTQAIYGDFDVNVNPDYVADVAKATKGKDLSVSVVDDRTPIVFRPVGDDRFLAVVMPITSA